MWTGWVSPSREGTVLDALASGASLERYLTIRRDDLPKYAGRPGAVILSLSPDGARKDVPSKVVPSDELADRARCELDRNKLTIVDCGTVRSALECQESILHLVRMKYRAVAAGLPRNSGSCKVRS